jgi:hypothetical protein
MPAAQAIEDAIVHARDGRRSGSGRRVGDPIEPRQLRRHIVVPRIGVEHAAIPGPGRPDLATGAGNVPEVPQRN